MNEVGRFEVFFRTLYQSSCFIWYILKKEELALKNGTTAWERWINTPVPIYLKVYMFTVINPEEISKGGKPKLKEVGPYVYREVRKKKNVNIYEAKNSISYEQEVLHFFDQEMSGNCTEEDEVVVVNPAILTIVNTLNNIKPFQLIVKLLDFAIPTMFESVKSVFLKTTIRKILFNGEIIKCSQETPNLETLLVCSALQNILPIKVMKMTDNGDLSFALLRHKNGSRLGNLEINDGIKEPDLLGRIISWNKLSKLSIWSGNPCNDVTGNDMTLITPYLNSNSQLKLFSTDICGSVLLNYKKDVNYKDIPGLQFIPSSSFLADANKYPENSCYCNGTVKGLTTPSECLPDGAIDISSCLDVPVIVTKPHFLDSSSLFSDKVDGLEPDEEKHSTFIDIEPKTGVPLQGYERLQINIKMENISTIKIMRNLPNLLFPLMWIEEGTHLEKTQIDLLKNMLLDKIHTINIIIYISITIGCLSTILSIIMIFRIYKKKVN
ncbi:sensory neuron membrane protein 2-like isoform X2 [Lycorma delicatula]|uniref:sensory neuron membrane protein 2-like isoform X2 n=1 Tax=Lycorma delicatula TaxID=130591 RepID=UPI003F5175B0